MQTERVDCAAAVPAGAAAMVLNLTVFDYSTGAGHWTAFPMGTPMPRSSNLNADGPGRTPANQAILPVGVVGAQRGFDIFSAAGGHFIVDVAGYFTGASSTASTDGLFVPNAPDRRLDTRRAGSYGRLHPGWTAEFDYAGRSTSQGVVFNLTTTQTRDRDTSLRTPQNDSTRRVEPERLTYRQPDDCQPYHCDNIRRGHLRVHRRRWPSHRRRCRVLHRCTHCSNDWSDQRGPRLRSARRFRTCCALRTPESSPPSSKESRMRSSTLATAATGRVLDLQANQTIWCYSPTALNTAESIATCI